ncbi:hypothetical protein IG206_01255 [Candidatus Parvarchaeota archaeon]|nr:hypothetical protein [Candidatus Acidifodinimicrobium mancum]
MRTSVSTYKEDADLSRVLSVLDELPFSLKYTDGKREYIIHHHSGVTQIEEFEGHTHSLYTHSVHDEGGYTGLEKHLMLVDPRYIVRNSAIKYKDTNNEGAIVYILSMKLDGAEVINELFIEDGLLTKIIGEKNLNEIDLFYEHRASKD